MWSDRLGKVRATVHLIDLQPCTKPFWPMKYRQGPISPQIFASRIPEMQKSEVVELTNSDWASLLLLVLKPDGSPRFCVDYRRLNTLTINDSYPLPRMNDCIDSLGEAAVLTNLDCNSGQWQVPVAELDTYNSAFTSHTMTFRFNRIPFGYKNAPATF